MGRTTVKLTQTTHYPWQGRVLLTVSPETPARFTVRVRVPRWTQGKPVPSDLYAYEHAGQPVWKISIAGEEVNGALEQGYISISRKWKSGDVVELNFPMPIERVEGNPRIAATRGLVALERGPVVYCVEEVGGNAELAGLRMPASAKISARHDPSFLGGVTALSIEGSSSAAPVTAIPYFVWNNRGLAPMSVWLAQSSAK